MGRVRILVVLLALLVLAGCARDDVRAAVADYYRSTAPTAEVRGIRVSDLDGDTAGALVDVRRPGESIERPWGEYVHFRLDGGVWTVTGVDAAS